MQPTVITDDDDEEGAWNLFVGVALLALMVGAFIVCAIIGLSLFEAAVEIYG